MWYKVAQNGFGGGMLSAVELKIQQALSGTGETISPAEETGEIPKNPIEEPTDSYEKRLWDTIVNREDGTTSNPDVNSLGSPFSDGQAAQAGEARRLSPYHKNPEETTMEEQLEAVRQENVNGDQSMSSTEGGRGNLLVRGEFPYASGKGWTGYEDLPSDKSWA